ncbi:protein phosphatase 2C domain-containing protein [Streptomyces actinomycinicus]|uniref:Protein phosphatase 2C domain-containing protein n=1 Tax=Streptomyces actinomycinicus TaxID=1695166 RepID=A0A937EJ38_9ACTN|nr:protein phosphatase 2C domain-containing protein [Streptomyces actinomycinicus]MBL1084067.1 protein phosphatase 2C domain-containing protein [Streptomyces actinomycinicus]
MSQQGGRPVRPEDDWWGQLYDDSTQDTGPTAAPDSLDDRFASARNAVAGRPPATPATDGWDDADGREDRSGPGAADRRDDGGRRDDADWRDDGGADGGGTRTQGPALREAEVPAQRTAPTTPPQPSRTPAGPAGPTPAPQDPRDPPPLPPPPPPPPPPVPAAPEPVEPTASSASTHPAASVDYVGSGPPTYDPEPTALPLADPDGLDELVSDTVLDGARYGACTLRAVSLRGDSARYRGEPRRDALLTARFGAGEQALVLVAMATGARATPGAHLAAAEACRWIGRAVGRSHQRLVADIRAARRGDLKSGLHRLTDRSIGRLRASAAEQGLAPEEYTASLRCLLLPADPDCRTRVFFGVGDGGLFRLRDGAWQDIEPTVPPAGTTGAPVTGSGSPPEQTPEGDRLTMDLGIPTPPSPYEPAPAPHPRAGDPVPPPREPFRFRASVARPGDALVMCSAGLADPLRGEPALCAYLTRRWSGRTPPGLAAFLADAQVRVKGYADDRTAAAVWEA